MQRLRPVSVGKDQANQVIAIGSNSPLRIGGGSLEWNGMRSVEISIPKLVEWVEGARLYSDHQERIIAMD